MRSSEPCLNACGRKGKRRGYCDPCYMRLWNQGAFRNGKILTPQELRMLQHIAEGMTPRTIAWRLGIKRSSVYVVLGNIYKKLRVHNMDQAVIKAYKMGLIPHLYSREDMALTE